MSPVSHTRKLIEVSLPLEDINRALKSEKSRKVGKPQHIHHWWARRPITGARAVLFAQLVDDPSSHPERFPTEEDQRVERARLHNIIKQLSRWESLQDAHILRNAHEEIVSSLGEVLPVLVDPFAGGGAIPMEAQRLGLEVDASDINPVAVILNKALIEIPPIFAGQPPVFPGAADSRLDAWAGAAGLAEDVQRYGTWIIDLVRERIGGHYPSATLPDGSSATVISWIWARTVPCPNPGCGIVMPLVQSWWLGKKSGRESYVVPQIVRDASVPGGRRVGFTVGHGLSGAPRKSEDGTMTPQGARCLGCGSPVTIKYIRSEGVSGRIGSQMMAVAVQGKRHREFAQPSEIDRVAANVDIAYSTKMGRIAENPRWFSPPAFGMVDFADLFTPRQLLALNALADAVGEVRERVVGDVRRLGYPEGSPLHAGGSGGIAYADAVATYLALAVSRLSDWSSSICRWESTGEVSQQVFGQQAIPMTWDYSEANVLGSSSGSFAAAVRYVGSALRQAYANGKSGVRQADAVSRDYPARCVVSTDPPYYDNIGYSDLSDFFYVWLRRVLAEVYPALFSTLLVPKGEELVANPYRLGGKERAEVFFEEGFERFFAQLRSSVTSDVPLTVYYAFRQQERKYGNILSTGWATILEAMLRAGWSVTATWPLLTELRSRLTASGVNALASSIVLVLRPRDTSAAVTNRRGFLAALKAELPQALREMQQGAIAPVDLGQATIGPGMAIFSRYARVVEADGSAMSVRTALALINQALDEVLTENDSDLDADSRFCLRWYAQFGWKPADFGLAETMANALNTPVKRLEDGGVLTAREGLVRLIRPNDLPRTWDPIRDDRVSIWEVTCHLARALSEDGVDTAARLMARAGRRVDLESVQLLAYRLYDLAQKKDPEDAVLFNALGTEWADLSAAAQSAGVDVGEQADFGLGAL